MTLSVSVKANVLFAVAIALLIAVPVYNVPGLYAKTFTAVDLLATAAGAFMASKIMRFALYGD